MRSTSTIESAQPNSHRTTSEREGNRVSDTESLSRVAGSRPTGARPSGARAATSAKESSPRREAKAAAEGLMSRLSRSIAQPLAEVEKLLAAELQSPYEAIGELLRHGTQLGGKRLRPALVILAGQAVGKSSRDHVVLGTVIEMVHTATLIHDDVLDEAETRRHVPTVNSQWNNHTSILLGDYLFAQSFRLSATLSSTQACQWIGEAARLVCEGELRQVLHRDQFDLDEESYIDMLRGKTAELCRVACELGASHADASAEQIEAFGKFGNALGIAFQIADDFLDLWGTDDVVGKTLGTDLAQGKMTLPLIRLLQTSGPEGKRRLIALLESRNEDQLDRVRELLSRSDARQYTASVAERYRREAVEALSELPASEAKEALLAISDFAIDRRF